MRTNSKMILMAILSGLIILMLACTSCKVTSWNDSVKNPDNSEYVNEVAFNLDIPADEVTQKQFNERYVKL